jgi:hypothetical protein
VAGSYENGNKHSGPIKCRELLGAKIFIDLNVTHKEKLCLN